MRRAAIGLGTSLGRRRTQLETTLRRLAHSDGLVVLACSRWYRTPPMRGGSARNWFLNGVVLVGSDLGPEDLLELCRREERRAGRRRANHWGDRTLDLDLLLMEGVVRDTSELSLPHPGVRTRDFVRRPLLEVWPDAVDPRDGVRLDSLPPAHLPHAWSIGRPSRHAFRHTG